MHRRPSAVSQPAMGRQAGPGDIVGGPEGSDWLVVCWFTPDYAHWTVGLKASLDAVGAPYHMLARHRVGGGWEAETMQKAAVARQFMDLHPGKTLVLLDVDCLVKRSPAELVASTRGDISAYIRSKPKGRAKDRARLKVMSGTMVFRPTPAARRFVEVWQQAGLECEAYDVDQTSLMIALATTPEFTFQPLDVAWCDFEGAHPDPAIVHDNAGRSSAKAGWLQRGVAKVARSIAAPLRALQPQPAGIAARPRALSRSDAV